jgi:biopolymer transport protein ExbB
MRGFVADVQRYLHDGGSAVMWPLVIGAVVLWLGLGYRAVLLRRGRRRSADALIAAWQQGERFVPLGVVDLAVIRGMEVLARRPPDLRTALDDALHDLVQELSRFSVIVQALVVAAPLAGLYGTVAGMIETFDALGDGTLFSQSGGIAGGIAQALITTQMGLSVAIPGLVVGRILRRRQARLEDEITRIKHALCVVGSREEATT